MGGGRGLTLGKQKVESRKQRWETWTKGPRDAGTKGLRRTRRKAVKGLESKVQSLKSKGGKAESFSCAG